MAKSSQTTKDQAVELATDVEEAPVAPTVHVAESAIVTDVAKPATSLPRYRVSLAYLPELFIYLVLLGALVASVCGLATESWRALEDNRGVAGSSATIVGLLAVFLISLPGALWFGLRTANAEHVQPWRLKQKWRRGLYGGFLALTSLVLINNLIQATNAGLAWALKAEPTPVVSPDFLTLGFHTGTTPSQWYSEVGINLTSALLIGLVLYGVSREYILSWRRYTKFALAVLGLGGIILGGVLAAQVYSQDAPTKICQPRAPYAELDSARPNICYRTMENDN